LSLTDADTRLMVTGSDRLGVVTALVYGRSRLLIGPMAAHAAYNAIIISFQPFL
jgi:hypothetical protein